MDVRKYLSNSYKPKDAEVSISSNPRARRSFSLIGYGPFRNSPQLVIETNLGTFAMESIRYPHYANWAHALDELVVEDLQYFSINKFTGFVRRFIRAVSIGASRGSHFAGLWNGFICTALIPRESTYIKLICDKDSTVHISRTASRAGLIVSDYSREMERAFRRDLVKSNFYITSDRSSNSGQDGRYPHQSFPNLALGISASSIDVDSEHAQPQVYNEIHKVNSYLRLHNSSITPQGVVHQVSVDGWVKLLDPVTSHYWPSSLWKSEDDQKFLSPTVVGTIEVDELASFMGWSSNWAHFVEDNLPSVLGLIQEDPLRTIYTSGRLDPAQRDALGILFPDSTFEPMLEGYVYNFKDVLINIHNDSRNLQIAGIESDIDMVDKNRLQEIRRRILANVNIEFKDDLKLFIARRTGFRPLINRKAVEEIFRDNGFIIVEAEQLGFIDRVNLFQNARIVAGETGAGLVNLYFCKDWTKVIEVRHPSVSRSLEHYPLVEITAHEYHTVQGSDIGICKKLHYGSDAYSADESEIRDVLKKLCH